MWEEDSMNKKDSLTSSELAHLWMAYQEKTMVLRFLEHFIAVSESPPEIGRYKKVHTKINGFVGKMEDSKKLLNKLTKTAPFS